ncbi:MAG: DUF4157 domain-containing protein [Kofleriaceae bacterium]
MVQLRSSAFATQMFADAVSAGVQREASGGEASDVTTHAARGVQGAGGKLPHLDQIQAGFGRHDVGGIRSFVGGDAATAAKSIGAKAYAMGDAVAFSGAPDVRQAAHEAAHVVQQRGGVQLDGGVGAAGDRYERHADDVADKVVRGQSAESMLSSFGGGGGGGHAVQREAEPTTQVVQAIEAVTSGADLRPTLAAIDRFHARPRDRRTELVVPIGRTSHHVAIADLAELRRHVLSRATALGAVRDPAGDQAIIDAAIQAVEANESGGADTAVPSRMDTSAPNPAEPGRGQHASYASASQMIPSHAIGVLRGSDAGRAMAGEQGLSAGDLSDASAAVNASNSLWDAVVEEGWTYERLSADHGRRGRPGHAHELELTGFTAADIARMAEFGAFRRLLLAHRERVLAVRTEVTASLETHGNEIEAQIAAMRAEPAPAPVPHHGRGHDAHDDHDAHAEPEAYAEPEAAPVAPVEAAHEAADPAAVAVATEVHAALGLLDSRTVSGVAGIRGFARPAGWSTMTAAQRQTWLQTATTRLTSARGRTNHVASAAADAMIAHELASDPAAAAMHFSAPTVRAYIHSEAHFLQRFHEDRGGWARRALQNHAIAPAADGTARSLDSAISAAAADGGGHRLTRIDLEAHLRTYLHSHPFATPEEVVRCAADANSGGSSEYRTTILGHFHRAHPNWAAEHPAAAPPLTVSLD